MSRVLAIHLLGVMASRDAAAATLPIVDSDCNLASFGGADVTGLTYTTTGWAVVDQIDDQVSLIDASDCSVSASFAIGGAGVNAPQGLAFDPAFGAFAMSTTLTTSFTGSTAAERSWGAAISPRWG